MNVFAIFIRHPRADLSAYVDGQLPPSAMTRLDAHLVSCEPCASEVVSLRALRTALSELPQTLAPRSFALTPGQVAEATPAADRALYKGYQQPPLVFGMRLASAGLAAALAFVVIIDAGNVSENGGSNDSFSRNAAPPIIDSTESAESIAAAVPEADAGDDSGGTMALEDAADATGAPKDTGEAGGADVPLPATGSDGDAPSEEPTDTDFTLRPDATDGNSLGLDEQYSSTNGDDGGDAAETGAAVEDLALTSAAAPGDDDGGGSSTLLIVEIALAAALGAALIASMVLARSRKF